jgi:ATP-dependent DNA ligase
MPCGSSLATDTISRRAFLRSSRRSRSLGREGIVSKRLGSAYRHGRVNHWLKIKNHAAPAVKRETEDDWSTLGKRLR